MSQISFNDLQKMIETAVAKHTAKSQTALVNFFNQELSSLRKELREQIDENDKPNDQRQHKGKITGYNDGSILQKQAQGLATIRQNTNLAGKDGPSKEELAPYYRRKLEVTSLEDVINTQAELLGVPIEHVIKRQSKRVETE